MNSIIETFAKRLKQARKRAKLSMDDLCSILEPKVSKQTISKYEAGKSMPNGIIMFALAKALGVDIDYFARPFDFHIEELEISFRKKASMSAKEVEALKVNVQDAIERYLEVEALLGIKPQKQDPVTTSTLSTSDDVRIVAQRLRERWGLGDHPILNVQELLESIGVKVLLTNGPEEFDGVSGIINKNDTAYSVIVINPQKMCERRRLTTMHELGHILLNDLFDEHLSGREIEKCCNSFASEMLFPESVAKYWFDGNRQISLPELKHCQQVYGVSIEAIVYKLHELGIINDSRYKSFMFLKNTKPFMKQAVRTSLFSEANSKRFEAMVYKAMAEGLVTRERAAVLLNQPISEVEFNMDAI
ncbi:MAG: XRE family transcriptional regulator [Bacteroidales bacterium]|nr:XRE family transcriptional regulator [Bacteroidales bacterium]